MRKVIKRVVDNARKRQTIQLPKNALVMSMKVVKSAVVLFIEIEDTEVEVQDFSFRVVETDEAFESRKDESYIGMVEFNDKEFHIYQTVAG